MRTFKLSATSPTASPLTIYVGEETGSYKLGLLLWHLRGEAEMHMLTYCCEAQLALDAEDRVSCAECSTQVPWSMAQAPVELSRAQKQHFGRGPTGRLSPGLPGPPGLYPTVELIRQAIVGLLNAPHLDPLVSEVAAAEWASAAASILKKKLSEEQAKWL